MSLIKDDIECLNVIIGLSEKLINSENKDLEEYFDDILKELLCIRGLSKNKVYEFIGCGDLMKVIENFGMNEIREGMYN